MRKLSLFDSIEEQSSSESSTNIFKEQKKEPMFENQLEDDATSEQEITENAFDPEEMGTDKDFNQETDEELLDIPTFLRRQAN